MFLETDEMKTVMYVYQLEQITENDDSIILQGINAAIEEMKSYLQLNQKKEWLDGRTVYDVDAVFAATGSERNALLLEMAKTMAEWWIIRLCNADVIYDQVKDRYDRAIAYLVKVNRGEVTIGSLPTVDFSEPENENKKPYRSGSRPKFNHY